MTFLLLLLVQGLSEEDRKIVAWAKESYGVEVVSSGVKYPARRSGYVITGENPPVKSVSEYLPLLKKEMSKYPEDLLEKTRCKRIVLGRRLAVSGQYRSAIPDFSDQTLWLDVENGKEMPAYHERVFHHEFFHLVDMADDKTVYDDAAWKKLNPPNFKYGKGGAAMYSSSEDVFSSREDIPGFLTKYGTAGVEEDKAEYFSYLFTKRDFLEKRLEKDEYLKSKDKQMKKLLKSFCPKIDDDFWGKLK